MGLLQGHVITACILIDIVNNTGYTGKYTQLPATDSNQILETFRGIQGGCITSYSGWFFLLARNKKSCSTFLARWVIEYEGYRYRQIIPKRTSPTALNRLVPWIMPEGCRIPENWGFRSRLWPYQTAGWPMRRGVFHILLSYSLLSLSLYHILYLLLDLHRLLDLSRETLTQSPLSTLVIIYVMLIHNDQDALQFW